AGWSGASAEHGPGHVAPVGDGGHEEEATMPDVRAGHVPTETGDHAPGEHGHATHDHGAHIPGGAAAHGGHDHHGGHGAHAGHDPETFRRRFWLSLVLTVPLVVTSE